VSWQLEFANGRSLAVFVNPDRRTTETRTQPGVASASRRTAKQR
jgi:hypothetical protein